LISLFRVAIRRGFSPTVAIVLARKFISDQRQNSLLESGTFFDKGIAPASGQQLFRSCDSKQGCFARFGTSIARSAPTTTKPSSRVIAGIFVFPAES
jgi:hypothetical protein